MPGGVRDPSTGIAGKNIDMRIGIFICSLAFAQGIDLNRDISAGQITNAALAADATKSIYTNSLY